MLPLWAYAASAVWLAVGAFLMQVMVQGAWGVIPVHLNELSPDEARGTFPGFVYQLGNLIASVNATLQAAIAAHYGAIMPSPSRRRLHVAVAIVILTALATKQRASCSAMPGCARPKRAASAPRLSPDPRQSPNLARSQNADNDRDRAQRL